MAAINHGGTFYRLEESSQSGDCGEANVMALHLASKQVMPFAFPVKGIPFGKASLKLKRKATASEKQIENVCCMMGSQPRYGLAVLPKILLSRTIARPSEHDLNNRFSCNLTERRLL